MKKPKKPVKLPGIRNITISGRIGTGKTTLANKLASALGWSVVDGGKIFRKISKEMGLSIINTKKRPDKFDLEYEKSTKEILQKGNNHIVQSHLAGFDAQGMEGVYKILLICQNHKGEDKASIRIDRLMNRDGVSSEDARRDVLEREKQDLEKFRRLYATNNKKWVYWNEKYYDLVVNTYMLSKQEALDFVLGNLQKGV